MSNDPCDRQGLERVGFIGLGEMGMPMAGLLAAAGFAVTAFDAVAERRGAARARGIDWAGSAREVVEALAAAPPAEAPAPIAIVMVRTLPQVEDAIFGEHGALAAGRPTTLVVMSTIDPLSMRDLAARAAQAGSVVIDAPVSGGRRGAEDGTLAIMAAGEEAELDRLAPALDVLGGHVARVGDRAGDGQAVKLANQAMMAAAMAGTLEGLEIAARYGVAEETVLDVVQHGTGDSWVLRNWSWMRALWERYESGNALDVLYKDMRALLDVAGSEWAPLPVASASFQRLLDHWRSQPAVRDARGLDDDA